MRDDRRLVYFSPVPWASHPQRPHALVDRFLERGAGVWWVDPYPMRLPRWTDLTRRDRWQPAPGPECPPGVRILRPWALPIDPLPGGVTINTQVFWRSLIRELTDGASSPRAWLGIGRPSALALAVLTRARPLRAFYDAMDAFPEFYAGRSRESAARLERAIAGRVNTVLASSDGLVKRMQALHEHITLAPNGFDMGALGTLGARRPPESPAFGYIGTIGRWFDWTAVARLAGVVAPTPVHLIGPQAAEPTFALPPNVTRHPPCSHAESIAWMPRLSAGLIPFTRSALTEVVDPIKYYLYRGAGLPVLSTRFGAMAGRAGHPGVWHLDSPDGEFDDERLAAVTAEALAWCDPPAAVEAFRRAHDWRVALKPALEALGV